MACMVVRAVVKANSQSNGKEQILTPYGSKTPEQILMKPKIYNYVVDMTTYANPCSAKTWHHMFWFLLYSWAQPTPIVRFWRSIHHTTCCSTRMCLLGVSLLPIPIYGLNSPKNSILGAWMGVFKPNGQNIESFILLKLLHRFQPNFAQR